jgi:hypothetical protein
MERRLGILLGSGLALAAAGVALALRAGTGTYDAPVPPPPPPPPADGGGPRRRDLPDLVLPPGFPGEAGKVLRAAWTAAVEGSPAEAARALGPATPPAGPGGPFEGCAPAALAAFAPSLEVLILGREEILAEAAMRCTAALARRGGPEGRAALARAGLVEKAFAVQAASGPAGLRLETARLLGFVGGKAAVGWLAVLLRGAPEPEVRVAAASALGEAWLADRALPPEAVEAVLAALAEPGAPPALLQACVATVRRAWDSFRPWEPGPGIAGVLERSRGALRLEAALFFDAHPITACGPAALAALEDADPRIVEVVAGVLGTVRPEGAADALRRRRESLSDPAAREAVERALRRLEPR